jgi:LysM repeat protein
MRKSSSATARILAVIALVGGVVVLVVVVAAAVDGGSSDKSGSTHAQTVKHREAAPKKTPASYVIETGDTLTSIAHATGVSVAKIERLNPEVDPQILIAGETLKLK